MATISKNLALELVKNGGRFGDDPLPFSVLEFGNRYTGEINYAVCYTPDEARRYYQEHQILDVLWHRYREVKSVD